MGSVVVWVIGWASMAALVAWRLQALEKQRGTLAWVRSARGASFDRGRT
ncbi:MAG: hypothetical protein QOE35_2545 [Actinomycetota bacterium]|jgi:hypothetical protein